MSRLLSRRCPKCSCWFWYNIYDTDAVHPCRKPDGTIRKSLYEEDHQGTRILHKFDKEWWNQIGINPQQPWSRVKRRNFEKIGKEEIDIFTFIELC